MAVKLPSRNIKSPYPFGLSPRATSNPLKKPTMPRAKVDPKDTRNLVFIDLVLIAASRGFARGAVNVNPGSR
jgi:hypothetical protein